MDPSCSQRGLGSSLIILFPNSMKSKRATKVKYLNHFNISN